MIPGVRSKAIRTVLGWQLLATTILAVLAGLLAGRHGVLSAALGGLVSFVAGWAYGVSAASSQRQAARFADAGAGFALVGALKAEGIKIILIVLLMGVVLITYKGIVTVAFFGTFAVATVLFAAAAFVGDDG
jgi:ATP synthase protein I